MTIDPFPAVARTRLESPAISELENLMGPEGQELVDMVRALKPISRQSHRVFAVEVVERVRVGQEWPDVILGAARAAFPKDNALGDEAMRERARRLLNSEPIGGIVRNLLGASS